MSDPKPIDYKRLLTYVKPYRWWIIGATLCGLFKFNAPLLFPWLLKDVIDHLLTVGVVDFSHINTTLGSMLGVYLVWAVAAYYRSVLSDRAGQRLAFDIRSELHQHMQRLSMGFYEKRQTGALLSRLMSDVGTAQNLVGAAFTNVVMDLSTLLLITLLLFAMNIKLALVAIAIVPLYWFVNNYYKQKIRDTSRLAQAKMEELSGEVQEKLAGVSVVQAYGLEKSEQRRFFRKSRENLMYMLTNVQQNAMAVTVVGLLTAVAPVFVVWYGTFEITHGRLTVGELVAFYGYLAMYYSPLNRLTELNVLVSNSRAAIERIFEVLDTLPDIKEKPDSIVLNRVLGKIEFNQVSFSYEALRHMLNDVNVSIAAGSTVALVGSSGAGKTTFTKLIPRFYDVSSGVIKIDDVDIRDISLKSLRRNIALVPQDTLLFSGTIAENIAYGRRNASDAEIVAAASAANADGFIMQMPDGYLTTIGERGVKLSGGQKQRIALARAFLKDAPILILDEATSALDSESERAISEALQRLMKNRTTIIIAHRLSTILQADCILVFDKGRIVETGTHSELIGITSGVYRKLCEEQFGRSGLPTQRFDF